MDLLRPVFNHLTLPPQLPGKEDPDIEDVSIAVLERLVAACETIGSLVDEPWSIAFRDLFGSLKACFLLNSGHLEKATMLEQFRQLEPSHMLILHVVEQNAALLIRREMHNGEHQVIFEAFEASAASEKVLAAGHALQWDFPGRSAQLPLAIFVEESFQESLASFLEQASMESLHSLRAHTLKAGVSVAETRDTTSPALVTEMLIPLLEAMGGHFQAPPLRKRVRDDINITEGDLSWRRLPFWLILRVAAQRQLCLTLGNGLGRIGYKTLMCVLFAELLKDCAGKLSSESTVMLRSKLCRRMAKLELDKASTKPVNTNIDIDQSLLNRVSPMIKRVIQNATVQVESAWEHFKRVTTRKVPALPSRAPEHALRLSLPNSGKHLDRLLSGQPQWTATISSLHLPQPLDRAVRQTQEFTDHAFRLAATEAGVERVSTIHLPHQYQLRCVEVSKQIDNLFAEVGKAYDSDPEQMSAMILALFTLWVRLDECAILACPLLGDYLPVFRPELLDKIQSYLARRRSGCPYGTILDQIGKNCFSSMGMRIQNASNTARDQKEADWRRACQDGTCYCSISNGRRDIRGRITVQVHEEFLPAQNPARAAVVFELAVPQYLSATLAYPDHPARPSGPTFSLTSCKPLLPYITADMGGISVASTFSHGRFELYDHASGLMVKDFRKPLTLQHICGVYVPRGLQAAVMPPAKHPPPITDGPECPPHMSIHEFLASEDTMRLLCQLAVQAGPELHDEALRATHVVFKEPSILMNSREHHCMELLITLTLRERAESLLQTARGAALEWVTRLRKELESLLVDIGKLPPPLKSMLLPAIRAYPASGVVNVFSPWAFLPTHDRWIVATTSEIQGGFGFSQVSRGKLPLEIRNDPVVKDMFGNQHLLTYPSSLMGMTYRLVNFEGGQEVHFGLRDGHVEIFAASGSFDLPAELVDNCMHWLNLNSACLEIHWVVDVPGRRAYRDIFIQTARILQHFERSEKLTLSFFAEIDPNQDAGTWYGLKSKLVLRDITSQRRSVRLAAMHVEVSVVDANEYGRYMIDETLHRLSCAPEPRLVYTKALYHAITSFCIPDPLTGRTGTEESFVVLKSGVAKPWRKLETLGPRREVTWNENLTMTIQHDGSNQLNKFESSGAGDAELMCRRLYECPTIDTADQPTEHTIYKPRDRTIARLLLTRCSNLYMSTDLMCMLESWNIVGGFDCGDSLSPDSTPLTSKIEDPVNEQWGDLINFCRLAKTQASLMFRLGLLAFGPNPNIDVIHLLAAFGSIDQLRDLRPPPYASFVDFKSRGRPPIEKLQTIIRRVFPDFEPQTRRRNRSLDQAGRDAHEHLDLCEEEGRELAEQIFWQWSTLADGLSLEEDLELDVIDAAEALNAVWPEWRRIQKNKELESYVKSVQRILNPYLNPRRVVFPLKWEEQKPAFGDQRRLRIFPSISLDLVVKACPSLKGLDTCIDVMLKASTVGRGQPAPVPSDKSPQIEVTELEGIIDKFAQSHNELRQQYGSDLLQSLAALKEADASPQYDAEASVTASRALSQAIEESRSTATSYFGHISAAMANNDDRSASSHKFGISMKEALVGYGLALTRSQRLERIEHAISREDRQGLREELRNPGHENWSPLHMPDWLLLEIDSDLLIRAEQVDVAMAIIAPSSGDNSVLQMNMGKGKTSCIVPMVVAALADGKNLTRLIVPKALLTQTAQTMQSRLGGLVGREICHIPFSRKTPTTEEMLELYSGIHRRTRNAKGLILTSHEHLLSYKLGGWQRLADGKLEAASTMIAFQNWLNIFCRDILDECDFTLSVKTQLNYPSGSEMTVDGHPFRWQVAEELLALAAHYVPSLRDKFPGSIDVLERPGSYPMVHFLKPDVEDALRDRILENICAGRTASLRPADANYRTKRSIVRRVLTEEQPTQSMFALASSAFMDPQTAYKTLLVIRGLVLNKILLLCLSKRWNVQYGLHLRRDPVAVPFEAKGTPSEQSEFGHPDVAILFTCLSFYYAGLTTKQLRQGLQYVLQSDDPAAQYEWWTSGCSSLPETLQHWNIINVDDGGQMEELWSHLRLNRTVINHYMNHFVFPAHARQFDVKLQASAWDIPLFSQERREARTTGFSGTNDNRLMLPLTIRQDDLSSLRQTSAEVLSYLLQKRNRGYQVTTDERGKRLSERELLRRFKNKGIRILIDAGAYILEMDNKTLASTWLGIDHEAKAAVYFGDDNRAWVHYRGEKKSDLPLIATPFADNLNECVVYLDEAHTRGVDFKLPAQAHGALTLALKQTKDLTMQAAMRLRQLRTTQIVTFFAPPEVDQSIRDFCRSRKDEHLNSSHVVAWLLEQTCRSIEDLRSLYVAQGIDFCRRTDATWRYEAFLTDKSQRRRLIDTLQQPERQTLEKMYGPDMAGSPTDHFESISAPKLQTFLNQLRESRGTVGLNQTGALEEVEQEREVQVQVEQVRQIQKPLRYDALPFPGLHEVIMHFAKTGVLETAAASVQEEPALEHAFAFVARSNIGRQYGVHETGSRLFMSKEFGNTVTFGRRNAVADNVLRPVEWILWSPSTETGLVIIPEEAELIIPALRLVSNNPAVYLIAYAAPVTKGMIPFNTFQYYTVPQLPTDYSFPEWFRIEVGILSGRLYVDPNEWESLTRYFRPSFEAANSPLGNFAELSLTNGESLSKCADDPAAFLLEWLALRRKQDVLHTPMGHICLGRSPEEGYQPQGLV
ncbi:hypothetical protein GGR54DRAFT_633161 [Hypoxylon sp. NC1633]|nr:hypothetical protein GGR54DRAFT_633161 [Hypoxylon sp. NC1633]